MTKLTNGPLNENGFANDHFTPDRLLARSGRTSQCSSPVEEGSVPAAVNFFFLVMLSMTIMVNVSVVLCFAYELDAKARQGHGGFYSGDGCPGATFRRCAAERFDLTPRLHPERHGTTRTKQSRSALLRH